MATQEAVQPFHWHYGNSLDDKSFALHGRGIVLLLTLLCILLLFALLYLYFRWACYNYPLAASGAAATSATVARETERTSHASSGLDAQSIDSVPVELHRGGENVECVICLGVLLEGEKVKVLPSCGHRFHPECVDTWLRTQPSCPLCRAFVVKKMVSGIKDPV